MFRRLRGPAWLCLIALAGCESELVPYCLQLDEEGGHDGGGVTTADLTTGGSTGDTPVDPGAGSGQVPGPVTPGTGATDGAEPEPEPRVQRFIALGDGGTGDDDQYAVADAIEQVCAAQGCDFAIYLGDVIYDSGVDSVDDPQFEDKFELPYANLDFPFYISVGNHDWGGDPSAQVAYTALSDKWVMPDEYYTHVEGDSTFFALDTNSLTDGDQDQMDFFAAQVPAASTTWKFAFGHHPYISNGDHGNTGGDLEQFVDDTLCGNIDVYFAGHDHDLQWLEPVCGVEFIQSGAAAKLRGVGGGNPTFFETSTLGFMWVEIVDRQFTGVFYDSEGNELFRRSFSK